MVNKAVIGVIGAVLIMTLGVGALVGLQGGGGPASDTNANGGNGGGPAQSDGTTATPTPNETTVNATATATPTSERTPIPGREFTEKEIRSSLTKRINEWRKAQGVEPMRADGTTANRLSDMATGHSVAMSEEGEVTHVIGGANSADRYRENELYDACMYRPPGKDFVETADENEFEALAYTVAGDTYETGNGTQFNEDEEAVASALLEELKANDESSRKLLSPGISKYGVGVEVTRDGAVYSTVNLCGG